MSQRAVVEVPRLLEKYRNEAVPLLLKEFGYKNPMQAPKIVKIVINMGVKEGQEDIKILDQLAVEVSRITGQKPVVTRAKKSISSFKLREGSPIGLKVTLRRARMYEFLDRLINIAMPRIRDFRGFSDRSFDQSGNYTFGLTEQTIFPEVEYEKMKKTQGMDITLVMSVKDRKESKRLLELLGFPFKKS
ncbi:MAG: 50S ribosomal protein L5 [Candidatus Omnitrophica bacterium ADurb.Bin277]|nr:MAG: 50S ribosomal protein L5 [Candidatus Omnitrophica bacterium ADurb.Bin277]